VDPALLEQYKLYVTMADKVSGRRLEANKFYVTLLSGGLAFLALTERVQEERWLVFAVIGLFGLILCGVWFLSLRSYRQLNSAKFKVIHLLEEKLPFPCYTEEWKRLEHGQRRRIYWPLSRVEQGAPLALAIPYGVLLIISVIRLITGR
jgi:hypothetical protein